METIAKKIETIDELVDALTYLTINWKEYASAGKMLNSENDEVKEVIEAASNILICPNGTVNFTNVAILEKEGFSVIPARGPINTSESINVEDVVGCISDNLTKAFLLY